MQRGIKRVSGSGLRVDSDIVFTGEMTLEGDRLVVKIFNLGVFQKSSGNVFRFIRGLEKGARSLGAKELTIKGFDVQNDSFLRSTEALAKRFGFDVIENTSGQILERTLINMTIQKTLN